MEEVFGYVERITFHNTENGYTVAQLKEPKKVDCTTIVGSMPGIQPGETIRCTGSFRNHLVHGKQFDVQTFKCEAPADIVGIRKYLGSGLIKGIGPKYAKKIVEAFGIETLDIIEKTPERLYEIEGIGKKRAVLIGECWIEQKSIRDVMVFLQTYGISPAFAQKIYKVYGNQCINKVKENPYRLANDIRGIGFKSADKIAEKMGIPHNSLHRIQAGALFHLSELSTDGHVCYPEAEFVQSLQEILSVELSQAEESITSLLQEQRVERFPLVVMGEKKDYLWLRPLFLSELGIARELMRIMKAPSAIRTIHAEKALEWVQERLAIKLAQQQKQAIFSSLTDKVHIITGGPGTGKSTITKAILSILSRLTSKIVLAAPTGRAAKRMSEITGYKASTIHSLLEFDFKTYGFKKNRDFPLEADLIIVDEASMIDTSLMYHLLKAIPDSAKVIFVGDIYQLPSVGPGNVLKDIIGSGVLTVTVLNEIFRQAAGSRIITNAHLINEGRFPDIQHLSDSDFFFIEQEEPEKVLETILHLVTERLPHKYNFKAFTDIQVLAPMKKGVIGTENLNQCLQERLNPSKVSFFQFGKKWAVGDKVMQTRNNYTKNVFNGDIGRITMIDQDEQQFAVEFDSVEIMYEFTEIDELAHAYAVSIHKYQGSECPCVVIPVHTTHFKLLHRNLLYTGVTRGKQIVVLVGTKKALAMAVKNDEVKQRYTGLKAALIGLNSAI